MSGSNRGIIAAIVAGLAVAGYLYVSLRPNVPALPTYEVSGTPGNTYQASESCKPAALDSIGSGRKRARERERCANEAEQHRLDSDDLVQQTRAADAAQAQAVLAYEQGWIAVWQTIGGALTLFAAIAAAAYARDAAKAARDSLSHAKEVSGLEIRPWLDIKLTPEWALICPDKVMLSCLITFDNIGTAPAKNLRRGIAALIHPFIHNNEQGDFSEIVIPIMREMNSSMLPHGQIEAQEMWVFEWDQITEPPDRGFTPLVGVKVEYDLPGGGTGHTERWFYVGTPGKGKLGPLKISFDQSGQIKNPATLKKLSATANAYGEVQ